MSVVIVDYGAGNLHSVKKALERTGCGPLVSSRASEVERAEALILPGVGAAADTMQNLNQSGLIGPVREYIASGRPFLGVCMGLQALMTVSEEGGEHPCLDVVSGRVRRLDDQGGQLKIPHMGWNNVYQRQQHPIFDGIPDGAYFYFVHSFAVAPEDKSVVVGEAEYAAPFPAVIARDNIVATQFHPEKSGACGLRIYSNFVRAAVGAVTP